MSNLEIKGNINELIAKLNNKESLEELAKIVETFVGNHSVDDDFDNELSDLERQNLEKAIIESKNDDNLIDHETVMKRFKR